MLLGPQEPILLHLLIDQLTKLSGINYLSIVITYYQDTIDTTSIGFVPGRSNNDSEIVHLIKKGQSIGLKVALKPHVDLSRDGSHWRGEIGQNFNAAQWTAWFSSYNTYMQHISTLGAQNNVDMIIVGTELSLTEAQEAHWRDIIKTIRSTFKGLLVYGSNWDIANGAHSVNWWDSIDLIGVDAYFPVATHASPSLDELVQGWQPWYKFAQGLQQKWQKPVMFPEIGYASTVDTAMTPWESHGKLDLQAQANAYEAFFRTFYNSSWFVGSFWWAWGTNPNEGGSSDSSMTPHNKPAEDVMKKWFSGNI